jgi:hypothetical protein
VAVERPLKQDKLDFFFLILVVFVSTASEQSHGETSFECGVSAPRLLFSEKPKRR